MRLAEFILQAREAIIAESVDHARRIPALKDAPLDTLRDHLPLVLDAVMEDLGHPQSRQQSIDKSRGLAPAASQESAAQTHGLLRARSGLDIEQLVAEYRVLRSCVLRLWAEAHPPDEYVIDDTMRFNEAVDQAVAESVSYHHTEVMRWRNIFLAMLGHDLRNPLNSMVLTAEMLCRETSGTVARHLHALLAAGQRMSQLLDCLLEYNKSTLGIAMPIDRQLTDLGAICADEVEMLRHAFPERRIAFQFGGDARGQFDGSRVRQALGNLISNAAQHAPGDSIIQVSVVGTPDTVEITTENEAPPIPQEELNELFRPFRRRADTTVSQANHLGLGLFIVSEVAKGHQGDVRAVSAAGRLRFTMVLPKQARPA
jgi:signal transduction histidine kinase